MSQEYKEKKYKGPSRRDKFCHWCETKDLPLRMCGSCKQVLFCSKECQLKSWPYHKASCKVWTKLMKESCPGDVDMIMRLRKWCECHKDLLRLIVVNALDLADNPSNADTKAVFLQLSLKPNHQNLSPGAKFKPVFGQLLTKEEARKEMAKQRNGKTIMDGVEFAHGAGKERGNLGLACLSLRVTLSDNEECYITDYLQIPLPTHEEAIQMIADVKDSEISMDWVNDWVSALKVSIDAANQNPRV